MAKKNHTFGTRFKSLCFVGLNKVEYFPAHADKSIFADSWHDVVDEQSRRGLALVFFAPRELDGQPTDPFAFLSDEPLGDDGVFQDGRQAFKDISLLDFCRFSASAPNTVNILVVADVIFHWDVNDCYIQPTSPLSWVQDLQEIVKGYPRTTEKVLYTDWNTEKVERTNLECKPVRDLPLDPKTWVNMPAFQETYGTLVLSIAAGLALFTFALLYIQGRQIDDLGAQLGALEASIPQAQNAQAVDKYAAQQEAFMHYRDLMPLVLKDMANAVDKTHMEVTQIDIASTTPQDPATHLIVSLKTPPHRYEGWLQQEPIAKGILSNSATLQSVRKPPQGDQFILEGLVDLAKLRADYDALQKGAKPKAVEVQP